MYTDQSPTVRKPKKRERKKCTQHEEKRIQLFLPLNPFTVISNSNYHYQYITVTVDEKWLVDPMNSPVFFPTLEARLRFWWWWVLNRQLGWLQLPAKHSHNIFHRRTTRRRLKQTEQGNVNAEKGLFFIQWWLKRLIHQFKEFPIACTVSSPRQQVGSPKLRQGYWTCHLKWSPPRNDHKQ